ncbi:MAG: NADH-quinone oxidoreductase subunit NuoF [Candidatus Auribacterota bacterium]
MGKDIINNYLKIKETSHQRLKDAGYFDRIKIQVGSATCENASGAQDVYTEFEKMVKASGRSDILLHMTGCTGHCSSEPIVGVFIPGDIPVKYGHVTPQKAFEIFTSHVQGNGGPVVDMILDKKTDRLYNHEFVFCGQGTKCGDKSDKVALAFKEKIKQLGMEETIKVASGVCFGVCNDMNNTSATACYVFPERVFYGNITEADLDEIIEQHIKNNTIVKRLVVKLDRVNNHFFEHYGDVEYFNHQLRLTLKNCGVIDPESIEEYIHFGGFEALANSLQNDSPQAIIDKIRISGLRGRGGGGYPTATKWANTRNAKGDRKFIICNADEGDPGAFMDRSMLEGDPFSVIEGMIIGGYSISAERGFIYIRAEYPLAIERLENAIKLARENGFLGENILGSGYSFDIELRLGAGAFVCGEETALIHSIEGMRGMPRPRPPYPSQKGLWGYPTMINNVETLANVPVILLNGPEWFASVGTEGSKGTKVFALAGKINQTGLVEVPMGTTLRDIIFKNGGGIKDGKKFKAVQTGGPSGGCLPESYLDTIVDYDSLNKAGSIMGSGGMIVLSEDDCMVDIAKFFLEFTQNESCGKCTPCREGTKRMLEILEKITAGLGTMEDLDKLERLGNVIRKASLCGLGQTAPNPVLSTLRHFRDEYETHVKDKKCPAGRCKKLLKYEIIAEKCVGCTACARRCPVQCISGSPKQVHVIDQSKCIKCGMCFEACKFDAVKFN